jgi:pyruvate/2-oxoglutarate dehydrogenase complex dihydrolipoamide acyltransferase (E2) component
MPKPLAIVLSALLAVVVGVGTAAAQVSGRQFRSANEAKAWLTSKGITANAGSMLAFLSGDDPASADVMRAYVALGLPLNGPGGDELSPLTLVTRSCVGNPMSGATTAVLIAAGADPTLKAPDGNKETPLMDAVKCPAVLKAMLAKRPNLSSVDGRGYTVMHHALAAYETRAEATRLVREAGFDVERWRASLTKEFGHVPNLNALLGRPAGPPVATPPPAAPVAAPTTASVTIDWESVGPFPIRSKTEAAKLLSRPGAETTVQEHFWDGIRREQPQRLALALQAGADVRGLSDTKATPLIELTEQCRGGKSEVLQSLADQLIAAKADPTGVNEIGRTALIEGAPACPIAILRALVAAGVPLNAVDKAGHTAMRRAISEGRVDLVNLLIDSGVDPRKEPYNANREAAGNKAMQDALRRRPTSGAPRQ